MKANCLRMLGKIGWIVKHDDECKLFMKATAKQDFVEQDWRLA